MQIKNSLYSIESCDLCGQGIDRAQKHYAFFVWERYQRGEIYFHPNCFQSIAGNVLKQ